MSSEIGRLRPVLPRVLIADGGGAPVRLPPGPGAGILLRDIDLVAVVERAANREATLAIDLDSVRGMDADEAAADFVLDTLAIDIVMTRRSHVAAHVTGRGGLGLLHALAFDSTGVNRTLETAPIGTGIGTVISPGLVLCHMHAIERERLARPIVAYGLLTRVADAVACLELAASVVLRQDVATALAATVRQSDRVPLTTLASEE